MELTWRHVLAASGEESLAGWIVERDPDGQIISDALDNDPARALTELLEDAADVPAASDTWRAVMSYATISPLGTPGAAPHLLSVSIIKLVDGSILAIGSDDYEVPITHMAGDGRWRRPWAWRMIPPQVEEAYARR